MDTVTKNKKVLILGASPLQLPMIMAAKDMGWIVGVVDYNNSAVGVKYADYYYCESTIDEEGVERALCSFGPDGIATMATDAPMKVIAKLAEKYSLPGPSIDTILKSTNKAEMVKVCSDKGVPTPKFLILNDYVDLERINSEFELPIIFKPTDNSGSRGVVSVNDWSELKTAYEFSKKYSTDGK